MNPVIWVALILIGGLLGSDWLIKRRRTARRSDLDDEEFLRLYRGSEATAADAQILDVRRRIATELSLPTSKIRPEDDLGELRDRYCLVVSGHVALGDLLDDLEASGSAAPAEHGACPETVGEYIAALLDCKAGFSGRRRDRGSGGRPGRGSR